MVEDGGDGRGKPSSDFAGGGSGWNLLAERFGEMSRELQKSEDVHATLTAIKAAPETPEIKTARGTLEPTLLPPEYEGVRNFHVVTDILTILALWAMERRRWVTARDLELTGGLRVA